MKNATAIIFILLSTCVFTGCSDGNQHLGQNNELIMEDISTETIEGNSMFAFDVFKQLNDEDADQNILVSPISISTALTMTYQGAATTTKEAMAQTLGYTHLDNEKINESYRNLIRYLEQYGDEVELNFANSIWISEGESIKKDFLAVNKDVFDAPVTSLDFSKPEAARQINQWITDETNHKIEKMVESPISQDIVMYLINAMYFKGDWTDRFDEENTFKTQFHKEDGSTSEILMMRKSGKIEFGQEKKYTAVRLPYGSGKAAMYCILPQETESINDFIAGFDIDEWRAVKSSIMERDNVSLHLPSFKLEYGVKNLNGSLTALGMGEAFAGAADFSGIGEGIYINNVFHKAVIEVNETGSEAAASTIVQMAKGISEPLAFIADRPFIFIIADDETGTILLMGKMLDPK